MLLLSLSDTLFYLFSLLAIASAFVVVTTPNPIHAVLFLVSSFAGAGCLLILFGAEYLGVTFIVVYVGAVAIVFLFVIMMLDIKQAELKIESNYFIYISTILGAIFLGFARP